MVLLDGVPNAEADQAFHMGDLFERRPLDYQLQFPWGEVGITPAATEEYGLETPERLDRRLHVVPSLPVILPPVRMLVVGSEEFYYSPGSTFESSHYSLTAPHPSLIKIIATLGIREGTGDQEETPILRRVIYQQQPEETQRQVFGEQSRELFINRLAVVGSNAVRGAYEALEEEEMGAISSRSHDMRDGVITTAGAVTGTLAATGMIHPVVGVAGAVGAGVHVWHSMREHERLAREQGYRRVQTTRTAEQIRVLIHKDLRRVFTA